MTTPYAEGGNYRFELEDGVARCRVWRRPDVDSETGTRWAEEKVAVMARLAAEPASTVRALVLDVRDAPPVVGPKTEALIGQMLAPWERRRRVVVVVTGDSPTQRLQLARVVRAHAPTWGRTARDDAEAAAALVPGPTAPPSSR